MTQWVLAVFVGTFAYAAAGLYTVGLGAGGRVDRFPRLAVSGAMLLLFVSVAAVIAFADHLAHSLQIDSILAVSTRGTLRAIEAAREGTDERRRSRPDHAVPIPATRSGYLQVLTPGYLLAYVGERGLTVALVPRLGDYVVAGTPVAHVWTSDPTRPLPAAPEVAPSSRRPSTSGSSGRCSRTWGSGSGSWSTPRARRSLLQSTTPTPPCRRSITSRTSSSSSRGARSARW